VGLAHGRLARSESRARGQPDLRRRFVLASFLLTLGLWILGLFYLVLPLAAGFMLVGPVVAVGLYEVSRRLERGQSVTLGDTLAAWKTHRGPIATMGLLLMLLLLAWIWLAFLIFALFFGPSRRPGST
jgi:uncharacterized membrane protein